MNLATILKPAGATALLLPALCAAQPAEAVSGNHPLLLALLALLVIVQFALIAILQQSRVKAKRAKEELAETREELEQRVTERTEKLRAINNQLYEEIAKHEITEDLLRETQDYLQSMINSMPSVLIGVTRDGTITHWNAAAEEATGIESRTALGTSITSVSTDFGIDMEMIHNAIDRRTTQMQEAVQQQTAGGQIHYVDLIVYPLVSDELEGAVIRVDDVTMRVRFENMMIQNEKMLSLGELAAGMAHEINNPLSAILHGIQNVYRRTSPDLPANIKAAEAQGLSIEQVQSYLESRGIYQFIEGIKEAGERSAHIVTNMLEFSRNSSRKHQPVNMVDLVKHSLELSEHHFTINPRAGNTAIEIVPAFSESLPRVPCSPAEVQQVILNILRNAAQALDNEGTTQKTPRIDVAVYRAGDTVKIDIADNGPGMNQVTQRHLFEPFYTTKDVGKGTGLGLSVSYFIITEHHDGQIEVHSNPGQGSRFSISLPLVESTTSLDEQAS